MMKLQAAQALVYGGEKCWPSMLTVAPCEAACPIGMKVQDYAMAIAQEKFNEAYWVMRDSTPFVPICAYVCHHPCEDVCIRGRVDEPIAIRSLKRFVADYVLDQGLDMPQPFVRSRQEKIAIIGSGPAGISAAYHLAREGYGVTIFEAHTRPGGMLVMGIPEFVLPRKVVDTQMGYIEALGVEFKLGITVGRDLSVEDLFKQGYSAVFVSVGAQHSLTLKIPGIDSHGVMTALSLIQDVHAGRDIELGKKIVVIGGGNVAVDAARIIIRLGGRDVDLVCLETRENMPAFAWEAQKAEEEGVRINPSLAPLEIITEGDRVSGIRFCPVECIEEDNLGRIQPRVCEGEEPETFAADNVVIAIGQSPMLNSLEGIELIPRGTVKVDPDTLATSLPGVFSGGDAANNAGTVVEALAAGKQASRSIERYLRGIPPIRVQTSGIIDVPDDQVPRFVEKRTRVVMPCLPAADRINSFDLSELGLSHDDAIYEARRCLNCSMCGHCMFERIQCCYQTGSRLL